jgi:DNA-binding MarR family transcriptional regulator
VSNIPPRPGQGECKRTLSERHLEAERLYNAGESYTAIAKHLGIKPGSVQRMIDKVEDVRAFEKVRRVG